MNVEPFLQARRPLVVGVAAARVARPWLEQLRVACAPANRVGAALVPSMGIVKRTHD